MRSSFARGTWNGPRTPSSAVDRPPAPALDGLEKPTGAQLVGLLTTRQEAVRRVLAGLQLAARRLAQLEPPAPPCSAG